MKTNWTGRNFTLAEIERSYIATRRGIVNKLPLDDMPWWNNAVTDGIDLVRDFIGTRIDCTSGFRTRKLNEALGGALTSQHLGVWKPDKKPCAAFDLECDNRFLMTHLGKSVHGNLVLLAACVIVFAPESIRPFSPRLYETIPHDKTLTLVADQIIYEHSDDGGPAWVHVGFVFENQKPRYELLRLTVKDGKRVYRKMSALDFGFTPDEAVIESAVELLRNVNLWTSSPGEK